MGDDAAFRRPLCDNDRASIFFYERVATAPRALSEVCAPEGPPPPAAAPPREATLGFGGAQESRRGQGLKTAESPSPSRLAGPGWRRAARPPAHLRKLGASPPERPPVSTENATRRADGTCSAASLGTPVGSGGKCTWS